MSVWTYDRFLDDFAKDTILGCGDCRVGSDVMNCDDDDVNVGDWRMNENWRHESKYKFEAFAFILSPFQNFKISWKYDVIDSNLENGQDDIVRLDFKSFSKCVCVRERERKKIFNKEIDLNI